MTCWYQALNKYGLGTNGGYGYTEAILVGTVIDYRSAGAKIPRGSRRSGYRLILE
jgi:hypothetical protein